MNLTSLLEEAWSITEPALAFVTSIAPIVIAVFTWLTWRVYRQIKDVMQDSFESEFRPVVLATARVTGSQRGWSANLRLKNVGTGVAHRVQFRTRKATNDQPGAWTDPEPHLEDLFPNEEVPLRTQTIDDNVARFDFSYFDLYGNEFRTELRGRRLRYVLVKRSSDSAAEATP